MTIQIFLTIWLLVQMAGATLTSVRCGRLRGQKENVIIGGVIGTVLRFVGIFVCLYIGDFYQVAA